MAKSLVSCFFDSRCRNLRRQTAATLKIEKSRYLTVMQNGSLKRIGHPPSWIFKINFLTATALEKPILHQYAKISGDRSYRCRDIAIYCDFLVEM